MDLGLVRGHKKGDGSASALCAVRRESESTVAPLANALLTRNLCISGAREKLPCPVLMASSIT